MQIKIQHMDTKDSNLARQLADLDSLCFEEEAMDEEGWQTLINDFNVKVIGAFINEKPVGFAVVRYTIANAAYFYSNAVHPDYRRLGIGWSLLKERLELVKKDNFNLVYANTRTENADSAALLKKAGFVVDGYVTDFYGDFQDALTWKLQICSQMI